MSDPARRLSPLPAIAAGALAALGDATAWPWLVSGVLPLAILALRRRGTPPRLLALCLALVGVLAMARVHVGSLESGWARRAPEFLELRLDDVEAHAGELVARLRRLADAAARAAAVQTPEAQVSVQAFEALRALVHGGPRDVAVALRSPRLEPTAWAGSPLELGGSDARLPLRRDVLVIRGTLSTVLVAFAPISRGPGAPEGWATAELPLATTRNIRNEFLRDYERLSGDDPELEVRYHDPLDPRGITPAWAPLPPGTPASIREIRSPEGTLLASVRAASLRPERAADALRARYRGLASALALLLFGAAFAGPLTPLRLALAASLARATVLLLGLPFETLAAGLRSGEFLSGSPAWLASFGPFRGLVASPLDVLLTAAWLACLSSAALLRPSLTPRRRSLPFTLAADVACAALLLAVFVALERVATASALDLSSFSLLPDNLSRLLLQAALLLLLATALFTIASLQSLRPAPASAAALVSRALTWAGLATIVTLRLPADSLGLPLAPALLLALAGLGLGSLWPRWRPRLALLSAERRATLGVALVAFLAGLLYPSLAHYSERSLARDVVATHAPVVLRQPQWRDYVLRAARRSLDEIGVGTLAAPGPQRRGLDDLAFALWSTTDLAAFGFSSAVEIQDAEGRIVSRFALNLPSLAAPQRPLPPSPDWDISRERLTVASAERDVVHAQRLLLSEGRALGALHVYVGDDYWNLPFLTGRDPYSTLFRSTPRTPRPAQPLQLLVYDAALRPIFSSADRAPALSRELARRARPGQPGLWTSLSVDGQPHDAFVFSDGDDTFAIAYRPLSTGRLLADLVEAVTSFVLLALALLAGWMLLRTLQRRPTLSLGSVITAVRERFALRLFWAFIAVAVVPLVVLQGLVGRAVADRLRSESDLQALDLVAVARKAIEDYAVFQGSEGQEDAPVGDAVLVWVSSLIGNDLDVFADGRLLASSKRELYASGLLSPWLAAPVYTRLALQARASAIEVERIGDFSYRVVSVPLRLEPGSLHILSIPLALRERDVAGVVDDLARTIRVTAALFLVAAAAMSLSMSRRISGPVRELTAATRRIAAGDLEAHVAASTRDELATLVDSFNRMAHELERQRRDLERTNRLAAWTEMARQVAHEVKNPLTPIQLSAEHLRRVFKDPAVDFAQTLDTCTEVILRQVENLREIVTEFSSFARPPAPALASVDLTQLLRETLRPYAAVLAPELSLELDLPDVPARVRGDRRLLERAVVNLIENALQAVGERGSVRVRLRSEDGGWRSIEVEDSGPGIDPEIRERIFEPFFSTKAAGSGLGLALVRRIAEDHGGSVALQAEPGRPTRAILRLPPETASPDQPAEA